MPKLPLVISAKRSSWRLADGHSGEADLAFGEVRQQVLQRDNYTCQGCDFRAEKWQEVHHRDDNHHNNQPNNLVTVCCFCHQVFHLGMVGMQRSGVVIWLPEISQADLHNITRAIFIAVRNRKSNMEAARRLFSAFESRAQLIEEEFGPGASNPGSWGQAMLEMSQEQFDGRAERFGHLRLLPHPVAFSRQIDYWATDPKLFGSLLDEDWSKVADFSELNFTADAGGDADEGGGGHDGLSDASSISDETGGHDDRG